MNKFEIDVRQDKPSAKRAGFYTEVPQEFTVTYTPIKSGTFNIYLFGPIEEAAQFMSAIEVLNSASELDEVIIHLSTDGGSMDATDTFLSAMHACEAKVHVKASGGVHSAGTIILLSADEFSLSENANFLIHNGGCGAGGKFSDFKAQSRHSVDYMERVLRKTYKHFLTPAELDLLMDGKDFWIDAEEFAERYEKRNEMLMAEFSEAEEAMAAALEQMTGAAKPAPKAKKTDK